MMEISDERFYRSIELARDICPPALVRCLSPDLIEEPGRNFYDSRIVRIAVASYFGASLSNGAVEISIEGPARNIHFQLTFNGVAEVKVGRLDLSRLPDILTLEFERAANANLCRFHFTSTDEELTLVFQTVHFSAV